MKATGIVRRIDDLGRVVIPKEIRRTLRIREGDPLEIFVDRDGEVILKKYSPINELGEFAKEYAEALHDTLSHITLITDRDSVIATAGVFKKDYYEKAVGPDLEKVIDSRRSVCSTTEMELQIVRDKWEKISSRVIVPIISGGDPIGAVVLLSRDNDIKMGDVELKLAEAAAGFLGKQMDQ